VSGPGLDGALVSGLGTEVGGAGVVQGEMDVRVHE
jgi:hypothetical protein